MSIYNIPPFISQNTVIVIPPVVPNNQIDVKPYSFTDPFIRKIQADILQEFQHWYAVLDIKQYYIGRLFLYAKRLDATDMVALNKDEREELWVILKKIQKIYAKTFKPDKLNFAFLGNDKEHCHLHVIPRYQAPRQFNDVIFQDNQWGHIIQPPKLQNLKLIKIHTEKFTWN